MTMNDKKIDLERLLKLRLIVARFGEMDSAQWWNTGGLLGSKGALLMSRGFPRTHLFAQAGIVFAVAKNRCEEIFQHPGSITLWTLPVEIEDQFDSHWGRWLDNLDLWQDFFSNLETPSCDLLTVMRQYGLISTSQEETICRLRRSAEGRAVLLPNKENVDDNLITLLTAAFSLGEPGKPAVPYALPGERCD